MNQNQTVSDQLPPPTDVIPHRPPFLFVTQIIECADQLVIGVYTHPQDSSIFSGHFPNYPIVPGVLILEGAAQTLAYWALRQHPNHLVLLTGADQAKWSHPVYPKQELQYHVNILKAKLGLVVATVEVHVETKIVFTAKIKGYLQPK